MVNRHRTFWGNMSDGKYEMNPNQLDIDIQAKIKRLDDKKERINSLLLDLLESEPDRQDETFSMIIDNLREWRLKNE